MTRGNGLTRGATATAAPAAPGPAATPATFFVVLADRDGGPEIGPTRRILRYPSGRPWIVGDWPEDAVVTAVAGRSRLALIGCAPVAAPRLLQLLAATRDARSLDVAAEVAGDYHVIAELDGHRRVQGTAAGTRRVFVTRVGGQVVAADRADVLARLAGSPLDLTALALSLLDPGPPHPLDDLVPWDGVDAVAPDHYLLVDPAERASQIRWWRRPEPELSRADGAPLLRAALGEAVAARVAPGGAVSCDLSGGLDSTSVCCLAGRGPAELVAFTGIARDPADDDAHWAAAAVAGLPGITREILPAAELPLVYDDLVAGGEPLDRPFVGVVDRAKFRAGLELVALYGPRLHLTGFGGDEIADGGPNYLPRLARTRPRTALSHLRGYRAQWGWPLGASLRSMLRPRGYRECLTAMSAALDRAAATDRPPAGAAARTGTAGRGHRDRRPPVVAALDWAYPPLVPGWLTPAALDRVAAAFASASARAEPLAASRDGHGDLFTIRAGGSVFRLFDQLAEPLGPPLAAPFLDDRVIRAALAVRPEERTTPWEYKPLLKAAMQRVVPAECLRRETKADASLEEELGRRDNQGVLAKLCDDSPLAELGLIDPDALREACLYTAAPDHRHQALQPTFAADAWLRVLAGRGPGPTDP